MSKNSREAVAKAVSWERYERLCGQLLQRVRESIRNLQKAFAAGTPENRQAATESLNDSLVALANQFVDSDQPAWLAELKNQAAYTIHGNYNKEQATALLHALIKWNDAIFSPNALASSKVSALDFDQIIDDHDPDGNLVRLFDELIELTKSVVESDKIDSLTVLEGLEQILAILEANRNGSLGSAQAAIYTTRFIVHFLDITLDSVPLLKEFREAHRRTTAEMENEIDKQMKSVRGRILQAIDAGLLRVSKLPKFQKNKDSLAKIEAMPSPTTGSSLQDEEAVGKLNSPGN